MVVPFRSPRSTRGRTAPRPRIPAITGTAAATAASKRSSRFARRADSCTAFHSFATSSLFAVTTCFRRSKDPSTSSRAGSVPPMTSTTIATSGSSRIACGSVVTGTSPASRGRLGSRTAAATSLTGRPAAASMRRDLSAKARATAEPTVPSPSRPTPSAFSLMVGGAVPRRRSPRPERPRDRRQGSRKAHGPRRRTRPFARQASPVRASWCFAARG